MSVPDLCAPRLDHDPYGPELADDAELAEPSVWGPMRRTARPVRWPGRTAGRVLVVVRFGAARAALWDPVTFSSAPDHPIPTVRTRQSIPIDVDPPLRTVNRRLTCRARSPAWVREKEAVQQRASDGLIENFAARGGDFVREVALPLQGLRGAETAVTALLDADLDGRFCSPAQNPTCCPTRRGC